MIRKYRLLFLLHIVLLFSARPLMSNHVVAGDMTYRYLGNNKYLIVARLYRDCQGTAMDNPSFGVIPSGSCTKSNITTFKRISIRDVTLRCSTAAAPCTPKNTSGTGNGVEEHVFQDTINLGQNPYAYFLSNSCCEMLFYMTSDGNRAYTATTYNSGQYLTVTCTINFCNLSKCAETSNDGVDWISEPLIQTCCNQSRSFMGGGIQPKERDSIQFKLVSPLTKNASTQLTYNSPFSLNYPVTPYCVPPTTIKCIPNPKTNPPRGFYFDSTTSLFIFTPTKCDEVSSFAVEVLEYRKDTSGNYLIAGKQRRDIFFVCRDDCGYNKPPTIEGPGNINICENDSVNIKYYLKDETWTPFAKPDTPVATFISPFQNAQFIYESPLNREKTYTLSFKPPIGSASPNLYKFYILVTDQHCPKPELVYRAITVKVFKKTDSFADFDIGRNSCDGVNLKARYSGLAPTSFQWALTPYDDENATTYKFGQNISFQHLTKGSYSITLLANDGIHCLPSVTKYFNVDSTTSVTMGNDTNACLGGNVVLRATIHNPHSQKYKYNFKSGFLNVTTSQDTFLLSNVKFGDNYYVIVTDSSGCSWSTFPDRNYQSVWINELPTITLGNDTALCPKTTLFLSAKNIKRSSITWNTGENTHSIIVQTSGLYIATVRDTQTGCLNSDSILVIQKTLPVFSSGSDNYFCHNSTNQNLNALVFENGMPANVGSLKYKLLAYNNDQKSPEIAKINLVNGYIFPKNALPGTWRIGYTTTRDGCPVSDSFSLLCAYTPVASFTSTPALIAQQKDAQFQLNNTTAYSGTDSLRFQWNFGRGINDTSSTKNPSVTYDTVGKYTITLTATSPYGCMSSVTKTADIIAGIWTIGWETYVVNSQLQIVSGDMINARLWLFDDLGRRVFEATNNQGLLQANLSPGVYFYQIQIQKANREIIILQGKTIIQSN